MGCHSLLQGIFLTQGSNPVLLHHKQNLYQLSHHGSSNYHTVVLILPASKAVLRILQARLQQYVNQELQMYKLDLEKAEEPEIKLPTSVG